MNKHEEERLQANHLFTIPCIGLKARFHGGNCEHCCLRGDGKSNTADGKGLEPNYSGWARIYVQACKVVPQKFVRAFIKECTSDNQAYREALLQDIEYFGVILARAH